jgi:hypothetical protein
MADGSLDWRCSESTPCRIRRERARAEEGCVCRHSICASGSCHGVGFRGLGRRNACESVRLALHEHIYRYLGDRFLMNHIDEFRSPDFHDWSPRAFAAILLLTLIAFSFFGQSF